MGIPYCIYSKKEIESEIKKDNERFIIFDSGLYKCGLVIDPCWSDKSDYNNSITGHLGFFAMSEGWEQYTDTGYHSTFFFHSDIQQYNDDQFVIDEFKNLLSESDFVFEEVIQTALF